MISESLRVPIEGIGIKSSQDLIEEWDSLGHLSILSSLSKKFGSSIDNVEGFSACVSVKCIAETLKYAGLLE